LDRQKLDAAAEAGIITRDQADRLAVFFAAEVAAGAARPGQTPAVAPARFDVSHLLWYAGALIVIGAMTLFTTLAFDQAGPSALTWTAIAYAFGFVLLGRALWKRPGLKTPAGLLISCAVAMAPLAIFGLQASFDLWPMPFGEPGQYSDFFEWMNASWLYMDLGTILAGAIALYFFPFPFIAAIMAVALWFLSMDLTPWIFHTRDFTWEMRQTVSLWFGLGLIAVAWSIDLRRWRAGDFAFWLHFAGVAAFWGALTSMDSDSEASKFLYCLINIGMVVLAVYLMRRIYAVFGALGVSFYLGHLAEDVFRDSLLFPLALSAIGLAVIGLGIWYFRKRQAIAQWMASELPVQLQRLRPVHAREAV
jgi:hypothetical protein